MGKKVITEIPFLPHIALIFTVLFWGMSFVSTKIILNTGFPPVTIALLRFTIAGTILFPIVKLKEPGVKLSIKVLIPMALSGLMGITSYFYCENRGIQLTTASNAALIIATIPIFTLITEYTFFKQKIRVYKIGGIILSILGVYFLIDPVGTLQSSSGRIVGNFFMLGACLSWVTYVIISKKLRNLYSGLVLTTYHSIFGTLFLIPLSLMERSAWITLNPSVWLHILYLSIICSAVCYFLYLFALSKLEATVVSSYINIIPIVGALGGVLILDERLFPVQIIGAIAILGGVIIVNLKRRSAVS